MRLKPTPRASIALVLASGLVAVGVWLVLHQHRGNTPTSTKVAVDPFANLDLADPDCTYLVLRHAAETGGNDRTRELAIAWLDRQTRRQLPLSAEQENWLLTQLQANGHASWDTEYRFLFFNSAFNVLHMGSRQEDLSRLLQKLAVEAPEKTMRLYALQHIGLQRSQGHLIGSMADEVRATQQTLASQPASPVAGTALSNLIVWDGPESTPDAQLIALALKIAENPGCDVDVRVTALHATGEASLPLARRLAPDTTQPIPLRKAAIARIGQHGESSDRPALETLITENFRVAQAAEPALRTLEKRLTHPQAAAPVPF